MRYKILRKLLREKDIDTNYLAEKLNRSKGYVDFRFSGRYPWTITDMYMIIDLLGIKHNNLYIVFPPGGVLTDELMLASKQLLVEELSIL